MTKRKLKPEEEATIAALRARMLLMISFFEKVEEFPSARPLRDIIENLVAKGDLRSMRLLSKEVDAMALALRPDHRDGLEALLLSRLGVDAESERTVLKQRVAAVLTRGTIASEKERRRLEEYVEMLEATNGDPAELAAVNRLLQSG